MKVTAHAFFIFIVFLLPVIAQEKAKTITITIDDLPVNTSRKDSGARQEITEDLLSHIINAKVPVIGFVNENKLFWNGRRDESGVDLLRMWLDAGAELGNHTYSHCDLNNTSLDLYEAEILKGEAVTKELLAEKGQKIRFFRHPYLHTGTSLEVKAGLDAFLKEHGYTIAPITIDDSDYIFSSAFDNAHNRRDYQLLKRVGDAYVPYMEKKIDYWERQSTSLFGRNVSQTLLIHANSINAAYLDELIAMLRKRGYEFVSLESALKDEAYRLPDKFTGSEGISWLHRWAIQKGKGNILPDEPTVPDFVLKASDFKSE